MNAMNPALYTKWMGASMDMKNYEGFFKMADVNTYGKYAAVAADPKTYGTFGAFADPKTSGAATAAFNPMSFFQFPAAPAAK
jgi:hypothetical protein